MTKTIPTVIRNRQGQKLDFAFHPATGGGSTLVLLGHGVTGNKDRPLLITLAEALAANGIAVLRFSFSGNGKSEGRFEECTITREVEDLGSVLDAVPGWHIGYAGHSMGAAVGVLRASRDSRLEFLISLAGMAHTAAFAEREFGTLTPGQSTMWDKSECPLSQAYLDDMKQVGTVQEAAKTIRVPWLFVHGKGDDVVPIQDSLDLHGLTSTSKKLVELPESDHVFSDAAASEMARAVVDWVKKLRKE